MNNAIRQQLIISGVGGQGVLFVTRLLAEAAIRNGLSVLTSETHGMAQRGGTVLSHLKVGEFTSPLIRPGNADGLLALHPENISQHGTFVKPGGVIVVNTKPDIPNESSLRMFTCHATEKAQSIGNPKAVNLVMLGFALSCFEQKPEITFDFFCSKANILSVLNNRLADNPKMLEASITSIEAGFEEGERSFP